MSKKYRIKLKDPFRSMEDKMIFGKHAGETLAQIAQFDTTYLDWLVGEGLCDRRILDRRDRGEYKKVKLKDGYAIVFG